MTVEDENLNRLMKQIEFEAVFGNKVKKVIISQPHGTAQYGLQLTIDNYYCGSIVKQNEKWIAHFTDKSLLQFTADDIQILGEIIDKSGMFEM
jgi:hypothetical protein